MNRPTFYTIWKRKSSEGFQALPYSVAFFSASLLLYYAFLKTGEFMIITINGIGCFIETVYLLIYIIYAPKKSKVRKPCTPYVPFHVTHLFFARVFGKSILLFIIVRSFMFITITRFTPLSYSQWLSFSYSTLEG